MFRFRKNFRNNGSIIKLIISSKRTHMNGLSFNLRFPFLIPFHIPFHSVPWKCDFIIFHRGEKLNSLYIYIYIYTFQIRWEKLYDMLQLMKLYLLFFVYSISSEYEENRYAFFKKKNINNIFFIFFQKYIFKYEKTYCTYKYCTYIIHL